MKKEDCEMMIQPYLMRECEDYHQVVINNYGISHFYELTTGENPYEDVKAVPDGCVDLLFLLDQDQVHTCIGGTVFQAKKWPLMKNTRYFGMRFEPGKCKLPKDISIEDIIDDDLLIDGNAFGDFLQEEIADQNSMEKRIDIFLKQYCKKFAKDEKSFSLEDYIRMRIQRKKGNLSIRDLEEETGYSACYIRRVFKKVHGISPKVFGEFVRFQNLIQRIEKNEKRMSMEELAIECGYYDQPHMTRYFKKFAGTTPETYLQEMEEKEYGGMKNEFIKD